jgi:MFS family permease
VLCFGAIGDRCGCRLLLVVGMAATVPADCLTARAPPIGVLFAAGVLGGLAAGMAYPTTLALITALWSGPARTKSIALWAATGGAIAALGPLCSGVLLEHFWWGFRLPADAAAGGGRARDGAPARAERRERVDGARRPPRRSALDRAREGPDPRDHFAVVANETVLIVSLFAVAAAALIAFVIRQRRAGNPLYRPARGRSPS